MSTWQRIDAWLAAHAPDVLRMLRAPVSPESIAQLEAMAGGALPPGLVRAYAAHDGATGEHATIFGATRVPRDALWARYMWWLSVEDAARRLRFVRDLGVLRAELVPFAADAGGNLLVVERVNGSVLAWDHETAETTSIASDLDAWMSALADDMDAGRVQGPPGEDDEDDRLALLDAPPPPPAPPPALAPDRGARVLIDVLRERRFVELAPNADLEPLVAGLHAALRLARAGARRARVVEVLEQSASVEEIFADDEKIGLLVDEVS